MKLKHVNQLAVLRGAVGLLGEHAQPKWWSSSFCDANGMAFLSPVFPRTQVLAQLQGVSAAAAYIHDDRIGIGSVFHLFRLPEEMEQVMFDAATGELCREISEVMHNDDSAKLFLRGLSANVHREALGPVRVGRVGSLRDLSSWGDVAALYLSAFEGNRMTFPFFTEME